jgi:hypothetical protein
MTESIKRNSGTIKAEISEGFDVTLGDKRILKESSKRKTVGFPRCWYDSHANGWALILRLIRVGHLKTLGCQKNIPTSNDVLSDT